MEPLLRPSHMVSPTAHMHCTPPPVTLRVKQVVSSLGVRLMLRMTAAEDCSSSPAWVSHRAGTPNDASGPSSGKHERKMCELSRTASLPFFENIYTQESTFVSKWWLKGKFSSGIEGALASTLNRDFNWKQLLSEMILCIFFLCFKVYLTNIDSETAEEKKRGDFEFGHGCCTLLWFKI